MRILYMSDLHLEMERPLLTVAGWADFLRRRGGIARHPPHGPLLDGFGEIDLVVMAGDIHKGLRGIVYAEEVAAYLSAPVVMVAGNHEYYFHDMAALLPALRRVNAKPAKRVRFLENEAAVFEARGERLHVLGATLWTDFWVNGDREAGMAAAAGRMNDHRFITDDGVLFAPARAAALHAESMAWLRDRLAALRRDDPGAKILVVTHHAPSARFLGARRGAIAPAYASEILAEFAAAPPDVWVHGHTHLRHDSVAEGIRVVSAPRGYVVDGEGAIMFRPGLVEV